MFCQRTRVKGVQVDGCVVAHSLFRSLTLRYRIGAPASVSAACSSAGEESGLSASSSPFQFLTPPIAPSAGTRSLSCSLALLPSSVPIRDTAQRGLVLRDVLQTHFCISSVQVGSDFLIFLSGSKRSRSDMSCSAPCWADAARTAQLKTGLRSGEGRRSPAPPPELALAAFPAPELRFQRAKELDASSGGCTSCTSSGDVWDDDDVSTVGSSSSDDASDGWTARETKTAPPLPPKRAAKKAAGVSRAKTQATTFSSRRVLPMVRPLELAPPLEYDLRSTNGLMKCVSALAPLPTPEQLSAKHLAINELQRVVDVWLRRTLDELERERDDKSEANATTTATLLLGGSWHLKVGLAESDLDVVALMPHAVTADHFFSSLCEHLAREATVSKLVARR
ncbi:hypothetical protein BBJ28_00012222, partial [Nothophytophthora sp. Chile5]